MNKSTGNCEPKTDKTLKTEKKPKNKTKKSSKMEIEKEILNFKTTGISILELLEEEKIAEMIRHNKFVSQRNSNAKRFRI